MILKRFTSPTASLPAEGYVELADALHQIAHALLDWSIVAEASPRVRRHLKRAVHETEQARAQLHKLRVKASRYN